MFRNRLLKILALLMVLNILIIPLTSFTPQQQNKYKVYAAEGIVDIRFYNAMVSLIGITAVGITGMMSQSFTIPEVDMVALKEQFQATLDADVTKKTAWMNAQADYLAGGIAKTMGAVELAKIGFNDIYLEFKNYIDSYYVNTNIIDNKIIVNSNVYVTIQSVNSSYAYLYPNFPVIQAYLGVGSYTDPYYYNAVIPSPYSSLKFIKTYINGIENSNVRCSITTYENEIYVGLRLHNENQNEIDASKAVLQLMLNDGFKVSNASLINNNIIIGTLTNNEVINSTETTRSVIPTIPWIGTDIPIGTVVTPAIAAPYSGAVPIDVPLTIPIDPTYPIDPPVVDDPTLIGTVAAILAGIIPISGILDNILTGELDIADVITTGLTGVVDGIGNIAGTLTGGITSSLTDIQSSISTLFDPPTETLNFDKLKNLNSVLFTKFPFSIPFDFTNMITAFKGDPVAPVLRIPFDMTSLGGENISLEFDLAQFDYIANVVRQINFIGFAFFLLFNTRKLIWK